MVRDVLELDGWKIFYLGTNLPIDSIIQMINDKNIDLIAISATMNYNINSVQSMIQSIRAHSFKKPVKFIVGGNPFNANESLFKNVHADGYAVNCKEAVRVANELVGQTASEACN